MIKKNRRFHRLSTKFICGITAILVLILTATLFINSQVAGRYYLHQQSDYVRKIGNRLKDSLADGNAPEDAVKDLENTENVLIAYDGDTSDYEVLGNNLREKFRQKGLGFQKFWLWDQDYLSAVQKGYQFRLYQQEKLNYGILVEYIPVESSLYAVAAIVPNTGDVINIINHFNILLYAFSLILAVLLIYLLIKHITNPLRLMESFSQKISRQEYSLLNVNTHDELEYVADSMNQMSTSIQQYQKMLQYKNEQMKQLLNDVAHDFKTPISLIGMYSTGIKDGLDDGTFLETIIQQNSKMSHMAERLISLSRIEQKQHPLSIIRLDRLLLECIEEQNIFLLERDLSIHQSIVPHMEIMGNAELITELFSNLLSNALKYASSGVILVVLDKKENQCFFRISNEFENQELDIERIWEPFYVGEASRNKALSGTGLGLSLVKKIADQFGYSVKCSQEENTIIFEVIF